MYVCMYVRKMSSIYFENFPNYFRTKLNDSIRIDFKTLKIIFKSVSLLQKKKTTKKQKKSGKVTHSFLELKYFIFCDTLNTRW